MQFGDMLIDDDLYFLKLAEEAENYKKHEPKTNLDCLIMELMINAIR